MSEAMRLAIVRQRALAEPGENYDAFRDLIEALFGADEDGTLGDTYAGVAWKSGV